MSGLRVLVDGGYRGLAKGTGISTYARTLGDGLEALGHQVTWLSGGDAPARGDALVDAALVADEPAEATGLRRNVQTARNMAEGLLSPSVTARRIRDAGAIAVRPGAPALEATLLAPNLFVRAHYRHMLLRRFCKVKTDERVDVLHLTAPLPLRMDGVRTVVTIHDLVPIRLPRTTPDNKAEFIARVRTSVKLADLVITVSDASKAEIVELLQVDPARIVVTGQTSDLAQLTSEERTSLPRTLERFGLAADGYFLFVGALEPKKNLRRLVEAFLDADVEGPLVLVGGRAWKWESEIGDLDSVLGDAALRRLRFLGHVDREDLRRLYAGARALAFPSLHEGFGLPALEAMRLGCPVIASHAGGLGEVCGTAAQAVDPLERASITRAIEAVAGDAALRSRLRSAGLVQAEKYSAAAYLEKLRAAYARLA